MDNDPIHSSDFTQQVVKYLHLELESSGRIKAYMHSFNISCVINEQRDQF